MVSFHHGGADADGGGATSVYTRRDVTTPVLEIHFEARAQLDHMRTLNIRLLEDRVLQNFAELLGWGTRPAETLTRIAELQTIAVCGNHDRVVAFDKPSSRGLTDAFTHAALSPDHRAGLGAPPTIATPAPGVVAFNGDADATTSTSSPRPRRP